MPLGPGVTMASAGFRGHDRVTAGMPDRGRHWRFTDPPYLTGSPLLDPVRMTSGRSSANDKKISCDQL